MPKISIIIPVYNKEKYLEKCLKSAMAQTLDDIEIVIINDGSTDGSAEICRKYSQADNRIRYYEKENEGAAAARQDGIEHSRGQYLYFLDADDYLETDMCERVWERIVDSNAEIVMFNCYEHIATKEGIITRKREPYLKNGFYDRKSIIKNILPRSLSDYDGENWSSTIRWSLWLRVFSRTLFEENGVSFGRAFRRCQDLQVTFECTLAAKSLYYDGNAFFLHQMVNNESLSRSYNRDLWHTLRPLIERLRSDCASIRNDVDLSKQMDVCIYNFAELCIWDELRFHVRDRVKTIHMIWQDSLVRESIQTINTLPVNNEKKYLGLLSSRSAVSFYLRAIHLAYLADWKSNLFQLYSAVMKPKAD